MKIAHLINAHRNLSQLIRLVSQLSDRNASLFVHLDRKISDEATAEFASAVSQYGVHLIRERINVTWGGFSQVQATLNGLRTIIKSGVDRFDYINILSGQDYPLQQTEALLSFLNDSRGGEFMEAIELTKYGVGTELYRYQQYHLKETITISCTLRRWIERCANRVLPIRKPPLGGNIYAGSSWWTITNVLACYILDFLERNREYARFFATTHSADEMFFQTIVVNSPFREQLRNRNLRYIDWSAHGRSPKTLTRHDLHSLKTSGQFYARKFDTVVDAEILDMLDVHLKGSP